MRNIEQELKLQLTAREYALVAARAAECGDARTVSITNHYFVGDDMSRDTMVRIRQIGDRYVLCYKRRLNNADEVMVCDERETNVDGPFTNMALQVGLPYRSLNSIFDTDVFTSWLKYVGKSETLRTCFMLDEWRVELDKCSYLGRTDYELECESDHVDSLEKLKNYLNHTFGIPTRGSLPKSQRFLDALAQDNAKETSHAGGATKHTDGNKED